MDEIVKILPCPSCGNQPTQTTGEGGTYLECWACYSTQGIIFKTMKCTYFHDAVALWNEWIGKAKSNAKTD